jgi:dephospho-CoA kinase
MCASGQSAVCDLQSKIVVGLIGGMGSGKSLVAAAFARHGARVISGDQLGHEALRRPEIRTRVLERWPQVRGDGGEIDRRKLGAVVFAEAAERKALEALVFPWIERRLAEQVAAARADPGVALVVVDAAIMLEAGWSRHCNRLVYVHAPRALRLRRLAEQRGWSEKEVQARERAQMSLTEKVGRADAAVDNSGPPDHVAGQVNDLLRRWGLANGEPKLSSPAAANSAH